MNSNEKWGKNKEINALIAEEEEKEYNFATFGKGEGCRLSL